MTTKWHRCSLRDLIGIRHGFAFKGEFFSNDEQRHVLVTPGNFAIGGGFQIGKSKFYVGPVNGDYVLMSGDIVVSMTDLSKEADTLGYSAKIPSADCTYLHNQRIGKVSLESDLTVLDFIYWVMRWHRYRDEIVSGSTGSTVKHTSPSRILDFEFDLPSLPEQREIAAILGALDDKIEVNRKAAATLEAMARALYRSWFVDFDPVHAKAEGRQPAHMDAATAALFPDRFGDNGLPLGWNEYSLNDFATLKNGYAFKSGEWATEGTPVIKIGSVKPSVIDLKSVSFVSDELAGSKKAFLAPPGSAAIGLTGYVGEVGRVPPTATPPLVNQRVARVDPNTGEAFSPFVYTVMRDPVFKEYVIGKSYGSAQANVSTKDVSSYPLLAHSDVVAAFDRIMKPAFEQQLNLLGEIETLANLRDTLLPRLMSGELRVGAAEKIVSEAV